MAWQGRRRWTLRGDDADAPFAEGGQQVRTGVAVGDEDADLVDRAHPGERALAQLGTVGHDHHLLRAGGHEVVDAGLAFVVGGRAVPRVERVDAEDGPVQGQLAQHQGGERADQLVGLATGDAAGHHDLDVLADGELVGDVHRVRHHGDGRRAAAVLEVRPGGQGPGYLAGGGAAVQRDGRTGRDQAGGRAAYALLLR